MQAWFMFDNHTFARIEMTDRETMIKRAIALFARDGCGSAFVRDGAAELGCRGPFADNPFTLHGRKMGAIWGVPTIEIEAWVDLILDELAFAKRVA